MVDGDKRFAERFKAARVARGLSQPQVMDAMNELGFGFVQQTVYKIENELRRVTIGEAIALADVVRVPLERLVSPTEIPSAGDVRALSANVTRLEAERNELRTELSALMERLKELEVRLEFARDAFISAAESRLHSGDVGVAQFDVLSFAKGSDDGEHQAEE